MRFNLTGGAESSRTVTYVSLLSLVLLALPAFTVPAAAATSCLTAGGTGFTAKVLAYPGQVISGAINAAGCDLGIFVPPGSNNVAIKAVDVTGANDHGIFAEGVSGLLITRSIISGNGVAPHADCGSAPPGTPCINEDKAVELAGTTNSIVSHNWVINNNAIGGIGISDDGPVDPGAMNPGTLTTSVGNTVEWNYVSGSGDCGVLVTAYDAGAGARGNTVLGNTILGNSPTNPGPAVGQIVVAADAPGTSVNGTLVIANLVLGSLLPGIVIHSNAPGDVISGTIVRNNVVSDNGGYPAGAPFTSVNDPTDPAGIVVIAEAFPGMPTPPTISNTIVSWNSVSHDKYGVWTCQTKQTTVTNLLGDSTTAMTSCPAGA